MGLYVSSLPCFSCQRLHRVHACANRSIAKKLLEKSELLKGLMEGNISPWVVIS